jgi:Cu(I)/Ag(I) efflux system membrane fusion protein
MKKNMLYIGIAVLVGLFAGWLIFGGTTDVTMTNKDMSDHDHAGESADQMWTCSMHPQVMQTEPGDCPICGMDLIPAESSAEGLALNEIKMTKNAMALANIRTTIAGNGTAENDGMISLSGKIQMDEEENAIQASYFDGRIERLNVNYEGQEVKKGQLLATFYAPNLIAAQQELITAASLKESQPALYKAVRNKLKLWKLSENQINSIEESGNIKENFPIYATVTGTVSEKMVSEGDYIKQGQPIVKVSNLNSVWAEFDAYENQISEFRIGQKIKIATNAYPNQEFDATVTFIDPVLNTRTRTVTVRANLNNNKGIFKPGMFVTGKIKSKSTDSKEQLLIPASAVMWTGERSVVYIKTDANEPIFKMQEITLGNRNGDMYTVVSGLQDGDEIVTNGTFTVDAAAQLQGKASMMNQDRGAKGNEMSEMKMEFPKNFQNVLKEALLPYLQMKDAFVDSHSEEVSKYAKLTLQQMNKLQKDDLGQMEKSHVEKSIEMLDAISGNKNLENQRAHFVLLNENMIAIAMNVNDFSQKLFVQKCPMANNNKGALWLSVDENIRNPYYGETMMTCGAIIDTIGQ